MDVQEAVIGSSEGPIIGSQIPTEEPTAKRQRATKKKWHPHTPKFGTLRDALHHIEWHPELKAGLDCGMLSVRAAGTTRRSVKVEDLKADRNGIKRHRYACKFNKTHGCKVEFMIEEDTNLEGLNMTVMTEEGGPDHDHTMYLGRQVAPEVRRQAEQLSRFLPRVVKSILEAQGMDIGPELFEQIKGCRSREVSRRLGDPASRDTVGAMHALEQLFGMEDVDANGMSIHLRGLEYTEPIVRIVKDGKPQETHDPTDIDVLITTVGGCHNAFNMEADGWHFGLHLDVCIALLIP